MESRHYRLDLLVMCSVWSSLAMNSRGSPASCQSSDERAPIALFVQDTPCSQAGGRPLFTRDQRDSATPRAQIRAQVDCKALADCLSLVSGKQ